VSPLGDEARRELERVFHEDALPRLTQLAQDLDLLAAGDESAADAVRFGAHGLRGAAGVVRRNDLADLCLRIERLADVRPVDAARVRSAAGEVRDAFASFDGRMPSPNG
jgi:chemotaxis protein histidine kinase CheA